MPAICTVISISICTSRGKRNFQPLHTGKMNGVGVETRFACEATRCRIKAMIPTAKGLECSKAPWLASDPRSTAVRRTAADPVPPRRIYPSWPRHGTWHGPFSRFISPASHKMMIRTSPEGSCRWKASTAEPSARWWNFRFHGVHSSILCNSVHSQQGGLEDWDPVDGQVWGWQVERPVCRLISTPPTKAAVMAGSRVGCCGSWLMLQRKAFGGSYQTLVFPARQTELLLYAETHVLIARSAEGHGSRIVA